MGFNHLEEQCAVSMVCRMCVESSYDPAEDVTLWPVLPKTMAMRLVRTGVPARDGVLGPFEEDDLLLRNSLALNQPKVSVVTSPGFLDARISQRDQDAPPGKAPAPKDTPFHTRAQRKGLDREGFGYRPGCGFFFGRGRVRVRSEVTRG